MPHDSQADKELTPKFVAVLNRKIPPGTLMNALGHMVAGLVGSYAEIQEMRFEDYTDKDGNIHKSISDNAFIVLQADNSNQIRTLRSRALSQGIHCTDFIATMTIDTYKEQHERTQNTPESELEYYGICLFGPEEKLNPLTKRFSLWKSS